MGLFVLARAIDISYRNMVQKGWLPEWKYFYVALYSLTIAIPCYAYTSEPGCIPDDLNKFYLSFAGESVMDMQMRQIFAERMNNELARRGIARQDPLEKMPKLKKYYQSLKGKH